MAQNQEPDRAVGFSPTWQSSRDHPLFHCPHQSAQSGNVSTSYLICQCMKWHFIQILINYNPMSKWESRQVCICSEYGLMSFTHRSTDGACTDCHGAHGQKGDPWKCDPSPGLSPRVLLTACWSDQLSVVTVNCKQSPSLFPHHSQPKTFIKW